MLHQANITSTATNIVDEYVQPQNFGGRPGAHPSNRAVSNIDSTLQYAPLIPGVSRERRIEWDRMMSRIRTDIVVGGSPIDAKSKCASSTVVD